MKNNPNTLFYIAITLLAVCQAGFLYLLLGTGGKEITSEMPAGVRHRAYYQNPEFYRSAFADPAAPIPENGAGTVAGILPHHLIVKEKIAAYLSGLASNEYETIVLIGPNHFESGTSKIIISKAAWETPFGMIEPDKEAAENIASSGAARIDEAPFNNEHSISGLAGFVKYAFPDAKILPMILSSRTSAEEAEALAGEIEQTFAGRNVLVLASVDFSHYQNRQTADAHDEDSREAIENFDFDRIYNLDIDSPPSITVLLKYAEMKNAKKAERIYSTNSADYGYGNEETTSHQFYYFLAGE